MSKDVFSILSDEEQAEFASVSRTIHDETDIDHERLYNFLFLGHKVLAYMVVESLITDLLDIAVREWNVKAGAKQGP